MNPELLTSCVDDQVFRAATLRQVVRLARRRRRVMYLRNGVAAACILLALFLVLRPASQSSGPIASAPDRRPPGMEITQRPTTQRVRTEAGLFTKVTASSSVLARVQSASDLFIPIATHTFVPKVDLLSDQQLLAAFPQHPALIAPGTERARLVFYQ